MPQGRPPRARQHAGDRRIDRAEKLDRTRSRNSTRASKTNPRDAQAKFKRGTVLAHLNRDDEAIAAFTELTQAYPELPEPYNNLAALYAKHGRYAEARAALETAIKANPSYALAYENLGDLYLRLANEAYKRAQRLGQGQRSRARSASRTSRKSSRRLKTPAPARSSRPPRRSRLRCKRATIEHDAGAAASSTAAYERLARHAAVHGPSRPRPRRTERSPDIGRSAASAR